MKKECGMCGSRKTRNGGYFLCPTCDAPMTKKNPYPRKRRDRRKDK